MHSKKDIEKEKKGHENKNKLRFVVNSRKVSFFLFHDS